MKKKRHWTFQENAGVIFDENRVHRGFEDYIGVTMPRWYALELVQTIARQLQNSENDGTVHFHLAGKLKRLSDE